MHSQLDHCAARHDNREFCLAVLESTRQLGNTLHMLQIISRFGAVIDESAKQVQKLSKSQDLKNLLIEGKLEVLDKDIAAILSHLKALPHCVDPKERMRAAVREGVAIICNRTLAVQLIGAGSDERADLLDICVDGRIDYRSALATLIEIGCDRDSVKRTPKSFKLPVVNTSYFAILVGAPGVGKSSTAKLLADVLAASYLKGYLEFSLPSYNRIAKARNLLQSLQLEYNARQRHRRVPVLIDLNDFVSCLAKDSNTTFLSCAPSLFPPQCDFNAVSFKQYCKDEGAYFILDAFDEVSSFDRESSSSPQSLVVDRIRELLVELGESKSMVLVTTRPFALSGLQNERLREFSPEVLNLAPFPEDLNLATKCAQKLVDNLKTLTDTDRTNIKEGIQHNFTPGSAAAELLTTPLQVHMAVMLFRATGAIENGNRWTFFDSFIQNIIAREGGKKNRLVASYISRNSRALRCIHEDAAFGIQAKNTNTISHKDLMSIALRYQKTTDEQDLFKIVTENVALLTDKKSPQDNEAKFGFIVKQLQEFFVASHFIRILDQDTTSTESQKSQRLVSCLRYQHWQDTVFFLIDYGLSGQPGASNFMEKHLVNALEQLNKKGRYAGSSWSDRILGKFNLHSTFPKVYEALFLLWVDAVEDGIVFDRFSDVVENFANLSDDARKFAREKVLRKLKQHMCGFNQAAWMLSLSLLLRNVWVEDLTGFIQLNMECNIPGQDILHWQWAQLFVNIAAQLPCKWMSVLKAAPCLMETAGLGALSDFFELCEAGVVAVKSLRFMSKDCFRTFVLYVAEDEILHILAKRCLVSYVTPSALESMTCKVKSWNKEDYGNPYFGRDLTLSLGKRGFRNIPKWLPGRLSADQTTLQIVFSEEGYHPGRSKSADLERCIQFLQDEVCLVSASPCKDASEIWWGDEEDDVQEDKSDGAREKRT